MRLSRSIMLLKRAARPEPAAPLSRVRYNRVRKSSAVANQFHL